MLHRVLCRVRLPYQGCHLLQRRKVCTFVVQSKGPFWSTQSFADSKTFLATSTPRKPKYPDMMLYSSNNWTRPAPETRPRGTLRQGATARARGFARSSATWQACWVPMSQPCRASGATPRHTAPFLPPSDARHKGTCNTKRGPSAPSLGPGVPGVGVPPRPGGSHPAAGAR